MSSNQKPFMNKNETPNADCLQRFVRRIKSAFCTHIETEIDFTATCNSGRTKYDEDCYLGYSKMKCLKCGQISLRATFHCYDPITGKQTH